MSDFIPKSESNMYSWLNNFSGKAVPSGTVLGIAAAQLKVAQLKATQLMAEINNSNTAKADARKITAVKDAQKKDSLKVIRALIVIMKANSLFKDAMAKDLQLERQSIIVDPINYKARVSVKLDGGGVRLRISKRGVQAVNIYTRLQGETQWTLLEKITRATYTDKRKLKTAGIAEIREYQVRGIMSDEEVGHLSDIVSISFGG